MAFSMFLRSPVVRDRLFSQSLKRMATTHALTQRTVSSTLPIRTLTLNENKTTPILNAVRKFRTSTVRMLEGHAGEKAHDHSKLWVIEKATTMVMVPLLPLALLMPNKLFDSILALLIVAHSFWGLEAIAVDYVRASIFGPVIPKMAIALVYAISIATLGGLLYIISHDVGLGNAIKQFWAIKAEKKA